MDMIVMGFVIGYLLSVVFIGIGYALGMNIGQKADEELPSNDELANALETMRVTGISTSRTEKAYLQEAAERLRNEKT